MSQGSVEINQDLAPQTQPRHHKFYRADIDGLRGIAVLAVILYHLDIALFQGGYTGVDIFLVISGFLITGIIRRECKETGGFRFKRFYARRIRRLFPALFFMLVLTLIGSVLLFSPAMLMKYALSLFSAVFSVSNVYFYTSVDYFNETMKLEPLLHTWSLSVEEQFYLFWPFLLFVLYKLKRVWLMVVVLALLGGLSFAANIPIGKEVWSIPKVDGRAAIFYLLPFRIFEFMIGAALVWIPSRKGEPLNAIAFVAGLALIAYATFGFSDQIVFPSYYALLPCLGAALLIWAGQGSILSHGLTNAPMVYLGKISYSLYLLHWPLIVFWKYQVKDLSWLDGVLISVITFTLSVISYHCIEQPFRLQQLKLFSWKWAGPSLAGLLVMLLIAGHIHQSKGWDWRIPEGVTMTGIKNPKTYSIDYYGGRVLPGHRAQGAITGDRPADLVLMGDSHANHYREALYELFAKPNDLQMYTSVSWAVVVLPGPFTDERSDKWRRVREERLANALRYIEEGHTPIVVMSHAWAMKLWNERVFADENQTRLRPMTQEDFLTGILTLKQIIGKSELVVIGQVPTTHFVDVYDRLTRPQWLPWIQGNTQDYRYSQADPGFEQFNDFLANAAEESGAFTFLDPFRVLKLQDERTRNLDEENRFIYTDTHHLSVWGSLMVVEAFLPELERVLLRREAALSIGSLEE